MADFLDHPLSSGNPPSWATAWGEDRYGVFVVFEIGGVEQRLRWIRPGRFWMGSPEEEQGRDDDEIRHRVTLTAGFWLADTPCTQALWLAVMDGENPSRFVSLQRPVEQVSWQDCQEFLQVLNRRVSALELRLPSEAEWEHACRAGTETATYAGDLEIVGANDAPLLHDIGWYGGNSGVDFDLTEGEDSSNWPEKQHPHHRAGTRLVAEKEANPWGLYDTLGNVWEWCHDWYGGYESVEQRNPTGPEEGANRVIRGGAWNYDARYVRAAYRYYWHPSLRYDFLGFRLALGQGLRSGR